jgi:hypothetical protein
VIQLLLFGDETNEDDTKSKNIRQTGRCTRIPNSMLKYISPIVCKINLIWDPNVNYRIHKRSPPVPILSQTNEAHITPPHPFMIHPYIVHPPTTWSSSLFPSGFPMNNLYAFLFSPFLLYGLPISSSWN